MWGQNQHKIGFLGCVFFNVTICPMTKKKKKSTSAKTGKGSQNSAQHARTLPPPINRAMVSVFAPVVVTLILVSVITNLFGAVSNPLAQMSLVLSGFGVISWFTGGTWYGAKGMGLRGGRPVFAGSGFAFLGWIGLLLMRFVFSGIGGFAQEGLGTLFVYLFLFEAFAVQLWIFGFFFRSVADWRGPLTAAVSSGLLFGVVAFLTFQESFEQTVLAFAYFLIWGLFYGLVRLRTGSIIGIVLTQAMQSLTAWQFMLPEFTPTLELDWLYTSMGIWYAILIWRLWPKEESDYRV